MRWSQVKGVVLVILATAVFVSTVAAQAPVLLEPPNGATDVPTTVTLHWGELGSDVYQVQVSTVSNFAHTHLDAQTADTFRVASMLDYSTVYYWRVRAGIYFGQIFWFEWSTVWSFTTRPVCFTPDKPILNAPMSKQTNVEPPVWFDWFPATNATSYQIQIDDAPDFRPPLFDSLPLEHDYYPWADLEYGTRYWWRVKGINDTCGATSMWSDVWDFITVDECATPDQPLLIAPGPGQTDVFLPVTLDWHDGSNATSYRVEISRNPAFSDLVIDSLPVYDSFLQWDDLDFVTTYWWRVRAENDSCGATSSWSAEWSFTTSIECATPGQPTLSQPGPGQTDVPISLTLDWHDAANATSYHIQIDDAPDFSGPVVDSLPLVYSHCLWAGLQFGTQYWWRVMSLNDTCGATSGWSAEWNFTTEDEPACCGTYTGGYTGNCNCSTDGKNTLSDITRLIDRVYISKADLCCEENGNTNGSADGKITLSDITALIDNVYISKEPTAPCL